jgi:hypothetical protein
MGLERLGTHSQIEVTVLGPSRTVVTGTVIHRTVALEPVDVTRVTGIPCTTGARTLVDLAARLDPTMLTALTDDAICAKVTARTQVYRSAVHLLPGRPRAQRLIDLTEPGADGTFRSWLERHAGSVFRKAGLPEPEWNVAVHDGDGLIGVVDVLWRPKVIVELEGIRFHSMPSQLGHDRYKLRRLVLAGRIVLPFSWHDLVKRPQAVVEQIRRALAS